MFFANLERICCSIGFAWRPFQSCEESFRLVFGYCEIMLAQFRVCEDGFGVLLDPFGITVVVAGVHHNFFHAIWDLK